MGSCPCAPGTSRQIPYLNVPNDPDGKDYKREVSTGYKIPIPIPEICKCCSLESKETMHALDCSHSLCMHCANEQLKVKLASTEGVIEFNCTQCKAPKSLKFVLLFCGCSEDVIKLDRSIRINVTSDKILRYDVEKQTIVYPRCSKNHAMTPEDLLLIYGKKSGKLDLFKSKLTPDMLATLATELSKHPNITELVWDFFDFRTKFADKFKEFIGKLAHITKLSFRCAKVDEKFIKATFEGLQDNQRLLSLDFYSIGLTGANVSQLTASLLHNFSLQKLDLSHNTIDEKGIEGLATLIKRTKTLSILVLDSIFISVKGFSILQDALKNNKTVKKLDMSDNLLQDQEAIELKEILINNTCIEILMLNSVYPSEKACVTLGEALTLNKSLISFSFDSNKLESGESGPILAGLAKLRTMRSISFVDNALDEMAGEQIGKLASETAGIEVVNFRRNYLSHAGLQSIITGLSTTINCRKLFLKGNKLGEEGAIILSTYLRKSIACIEELDISVNKICNKGGVLIVDALRENARLKILNMEENELGDEFAVGLSKMMKENSTLEIIILESNLITNEGANSIAEGIAVAKGIHTINLENNTFNHFGMAPVLTARLKNLRIKILSSELTYFMMSIGGNY